MTVKNTRIAGRYMYSVRWLVTDWHNKSPKTLIYTG
jgi:hypothetical protein